MFVRNEHSFRLLDFFRIRERTAEYCLSEEGALLLRASYPIGDGPLLRSVKADVQVLVDHYSANEQPSFSFPQIGPALKNLAVQGMTLEIEELYALGLWAKEFDRLVASLARVKFSADREASNRTDAAGSVAAAGATAAVAVKAAETVTSADLSDDGTDFDPQALADLWADFRVTKVLGDSPKLQDVYKIVFGVVTPDGELRDLPEVRRIKDSIARSNRDLLSIADSYRNDPDLRSALQSEEPTQRDGRTVLAVRANFKGRVKGIVHEVSSTGQTVFIEPEALVEKNNELVQLEARLRAEIFRVLKETTESLRKNVPSMRGARKRLALLDARHARAIQCKREELILAEECPAGLTLWRARHPLLGKKAVPIDVVAPESARTLIVTGPNTGGKTVTLKTIGLFALMHQFGLGLPAALGTKLPLFDAVLADIGDEQSIDQSLSTFSGHMKVIADVVQNVTSESLVLLDELGAGTDPEEGCAIAMGLLDFFIEKGSLTIATTHHGILKNYGYTRPGCLNASMEFDSTRLAPTYRIVMGIPGESRALEIAAQTGMPDDIVGRARRYLAEERTDIGELIRSLSEKHRELEKLEREQRRRLKDASEGQRKADLAALRVRQREIELRRHGLSDLKNLLNESRKTLENLVRELKESGVGTDRTKEVKKFLADLSASVERQYGVLESEVKEAKEGEEMAASSDFSQAEYEAASGEGGEKAAIAVDMVVGYGPFRKKARVVRKAGAGRWIIEIGSMRLTANESDLLPLGRQKEERPAYDVELAPLDDKGSSRASFEMDLRGLRLSEALTAVERQIDAASLQGLTLFSIIHGTGEGVLGKGIQEYLRSSPAVQEYHFARPEEGGYGKTVVRLKA